MNDYEKTIKDLQDRVKLLEERLTPCTGAVAEPKKGSPVGGKWFINPFGGVGHANTDSQIKQFGCERPTQQQDERAAVEMRRFNRLLALRDELCEGEGDGNWLTGKNNYWVYYDYEEDNYGFCSNSIMQTIGLVYFTSEQTVKRACDMLNSGEVEL
jgi:hypothetical protein